MRKTLAILAAAAVLTGGSLVTAAPAAAEHAPACFDGSPLIRKGSSGSCVTTIQTVLRRNGYTLDVDGIFGHQTFDRLYRFQGRFDLKQDGIVGVQTGQVLLACRYGCA